MSQLRVDLLGGYAPDVLTPAGRRAHRKAAALFTPVRARVTDALGANETQVHEVLLSLRTVLDQVRQPEPLAARSAPHSATQ